jgi:hypothetical protein
MKTKLPYQNIHTEWISDALGVTMDVALRVQKIINEKYDLDWSEAEFEEIKFVSMMAFEDLNIDYNF